MHDEREGTNAQRGSSALRQAAAHAARSHSDGGAGAGQQANKPFEEETKTTTVNAHGCLISLATPVTRGQRVSIVNPKTAEEVECKVAYISENKGSKTEVGLEFTEASPLFWRIGFPPEDWVDSSERKAAWTFPCAGSASACGYFGS